MHTLPTFKELRVADGVQGVGASQVCTQPSRRLVSHLDAILQDGYWEGRAGHGCHPQPAVQGREEVGGERGRGYGIRLEPGGGVTDHPWAQ